MNTNHSIPQTLIEAIRYFADPGVCREFVASLRWPNGPECPRCGSKEHSFLSTRGLWKCKGCKKQYSVKVGTIFEDSPLGLDKWLPAVWMIANCKNGVSSYEIHRALGITQKSAWFMMHRIRLAMQCGSFRKMEGEIEADETFIGGKARNMHKGKRKAKGTGAAGKEIVMGLLERETGKVKVKHVSSTRRGVVQGEVRENVAEGSAVYTDALPSYEGLAPDYAHEVVNHAEKYVDGRVHTNGLENFWCLLKRSIKGTYTQVMPFHLFRYLDEQAFRFNERDGNDAERFVGVASRITGRRLTYEGLIGE